MNASSITLAITLLDALPGLILASTEVLSLISSTSATLSKMQAENRDPTDEEWSALHSIIATLTARINAEPV